MQRGANGTLAQLYSDLGAGSSNNAWNNFIAAVQNLPGPITSDDPFGGGAQLSQLTHISPETLAIAGRIFSAIVSDVAAGKSHQRIVASVRVAMAPVPHDVAAD